MNETEQRNPNAERREDTVHEELAHLAGRYLTFHLAGELYGVRILNVREIIGLQEITRVPDTPRHLKGVINLRGQVIPVVDLRRRFKLPDAEQTEETCIIILDVGEHCIGMIVDEVDEVADLGPGDIEPAPSFHSDLEENYLSGMGKADGRLLILLDTDAVLRAEHANEEFGEAG